jgi:hypothetical protein
MIDALLSRGLVAETLGDYRLGDAATLIEDASTGLMLTTLALTDAGLIAIGHVAPTETAAPTEATASDVDADTAPQAATDAAVAQEAAAVADALDAATVAATAATPARTTLRQAAQAMLAAWDDEANRETDIIAALEGPMAALRSLLTGKAPRNAGAPRKPRTGTKQEAVLALLRRAEGATVAQIAEATGWATHTVRGFLAGLKKKGFKVEALDKVQMAGPGKQGAKGSYTTYGIAN